MVRAVCSALALAAVAGAASADVIGESVRYAGSVYTDVQGNAQSGHNRAGVTVYSNTSSPANVATSSLDLNTTWGDEALTVGTGTLEEFSLTVFNSSSSGNTGLILTYKAEIGFYRMSDNSYIGGFIGNINFGTGLNPGFYSVVTFTGLSGFAIDIDSTDILITQQRLEHTGTSIRMGVASLVPVTVGSSPTSFYKDDPSAPPAGFYTFSSGAPGDLGYNINVIPAPASAAMLTCAGLFAGRRRR